MKTIVESVIKQKSQVSHEIKLKLELSKSMAKTHADDSDRATEIEQRNLLELELKRLKKKERVLDQAMARYEHGVFGACDDCGVEIPIKRLEAAPDAECCIDCQSIRELRVRQRSVA